MFMEITRREDIGTDLNAPLLARGGGVIKSQSRVGSSGFVTARPAGQAGCAYLGERGIGSGDVDHQTFRLQARGTRFSMGCGPGSYAALPSLRGNLPGTYRRSAGVCTSDGVAAGIG
jgi:hypothetical protein